MIINTGYNFSAIRNIVEAAENLQEAGKDEDCEKILLDLANTLKEE